MSVSIDNGFIYSLVTSGKAQDLSSGVEVEMLRGPAQGAFSFIVDYFREHRKFPTMEIVTEYSGINFDDVVGADIGHWVSEVKNRHLHGIIRDGLSGVTNSMDDKKPFDALKSIEKILEDARKLNLTKNKVLNLFSLGDAVLRQYEKTKLGECGIMTPWKSLNEATLGWQPADFVVFAARNKVGKTWVLLNLAKNAYEQGKKILLLSAEMSTISLAMRFYSLLFRRPYGKIRKGKLGTIDEAQFYNEIRSKSDSTGVFIIGDDFNVDIRSLDTAIMELRPDIVFVDGLYLLDVTGVSNRFEKAPIIADESKKMARRYNIPLIGSTQFSRKAVGVKDEELDTSMISLSDQFAWNVDYMFAIVRSKEMRESKELHVKTLAIREGEPVDFVLNWDFETMDFSEKDKPKYTSFKDAGYKKDTSFFSKGFTRAHKEKDEEQTVYMDDGSKVPF